MSHDSHPCSGLQLGQRGATDSLTIDGVDRGGVGGQVEGQRGVAEQRVLQLVDGAVAISIGDHVVLCQSLSLTHRDGLAVVVQTQHAAQEGHVESLVGVGIHRARGAVEGHSTAIGIEHGLLADGGGGAIEGHDVAGSRNPQRQVFVGELAEVAQREHSLVRDLILDAVTGIVEDERAFGLLLLDGSRGSGIAVAGRRGQARIGIPHHLLNLVAGMERGDILSGGIDVAHVEVVVAVVAHKHQRVGPGAGVEVVGVVDDLVDHHLGLSVGGDGEAAHGDIEFVARGGIESLTVVEQTEETVVDIAIDLAE